MTSNLMGYQVHKYDLEIQYKKGINNVVTNSSFQVHGLHTTSITKLQWKKEKLSEYAINEMASSMLYELDKTQEGTKNTQY